MKNVLRLSALAMSLAAFTVSAQQTMMTSTQYSAEKDRIDQTYNAERKKCDALSGNAKDVCVAQAKADEKRAKAKLDLDRQPDARRQFKYVEASAEAEYSVAAEKCDDLSGNAKDVCVKEARAKRDKQIADAKAARDSKSARAEAAQEKRDADRSVEMARCDALSGAAKEQCMAQARAKNPQ
jgi:hypothetical protein